LEGIASVQLAAFAGADPSCWSLCETNVNTALHPAYPQELAQNEIIATIETQPGQYNLQFKRPITPGETTMIMYTNDLGEVNSFRFTAHPGNVDANSTTHAADLLMLIDILNEVASAPWGLFSTDCDHSGITTPADILCVIDLLNSGWIASVRPSIRRSAHENAVRVRNPAARPTRMMETYDQGAQNMKEKNNFQRGAVTMVDVAAVMGTLATLAVCLASAAAGIRVSSKESRCLLNLSQTGLASSIYSAQDPADMAIPVHDLQFAQDRNNPTFIGAYEWGGKSGRGWDTWLGPADPLNSKYGTKAGFGPNTRPLNGIIYRESFADHLNPEFDSAGALVDTLLDLDVQHCPADTGYSGVHFPTFRDSKLVVRPFPRVTTANVFSFGYGGGGPINYNSPYLRRLADVKSPATTLLYYENNGRYAWSAGPTPEECSDVIGKTPPGPVRGWHGKNWMLNATFADGHADMIYMRGFVNTYIPYSPDPTTNVDQINEQFRCVIIRGEGWQLDPSPLIPSLAVWNRLDLAAPLGSTESNDRLQNNLDSEIPFGRAGANPCGDCRVARICDACNCPGRRAQRYDRNRTSCSV
jgi:prepilin-type processing-associated H-X9-DG protein